MTDETTTPLTHQEPAAAHTDAPSPTEHARDMEGLGGHVDEHISDDPGHGEQRLGPIDWGAWGYGVLGVAAGLVVVIAFWLAIA